MERNDSEYIESLLPRFCEGLTTEAESREVEAWLAEDEAHQAALNRMHVLHLAADLAQINKQVDVEAALKSVHRRIGGKRVSWWKWTQRVAAILVLPLLMGTFFLYQQLGRQSDPVQWMVVRTNPGMTTSLVLPDQTVVHLNSESMLRYPSRFEGKTRQVEMSGEVYFEVAKDVEKRFVVNIPHESQIEVYGTRFNVEAYDDEAFVSTTLLDGSVGFFYRNETGKSHKVQLKPCQKLVYEPENHQVQVYRTSCVSELAWKDGKLVFDNTPMKEILHMLGKRFAVEFLIRNPRLVENSFTGTFSNQRLERILEFFRVSSHINWRYVDSEDLSDEKQYIEIF